MSATEPVLVEVTRGGRRESWHRGTLVVLDVDGGVGLGVGALDEPVFARSALKPLQATALVGAGFAQEPAALALACASHDGADIHRAGARAILAAAGLGEAALRCPADLPWGRGALVSYVAGGGVAAPVCHNCSGKHAAMLATCVRNGWDVGTYLDERHPVQRAAAETVARLCGAPIAATSVDGCGAPAFALLPAALARGFAAIARVSEAAEAPHAPGAPSPEAAVREAMRAHPLLVGGAGRAVSELLAEVDGLVTKDGAEGVWAAALADGRAFAVKITDGAARALPAVAAAVLASWGFDGPAVRRWAAVPVPGGGQPVGEVRVTAELAALLS